MKIWPTVSIQKKTFEQLLYKTSLNVLYKVYLTQENLDGNISKDCYTLDDVDPQCYNKLGLRNMSDVALPFIL